MKLETSTDLLERLRTKQGSSWYGLAALLGTHTNTVYNWKGGHTVVDRKFAPRIAELLDEPPEYILACLEAEREATPELQRVWARIAAKFRSRASSILLAVLMLFGLSALPAQGVRAAETGEHFAETVYSVKSRRRGLKAAFA